MTPEMIQTIGIVLGALMGGGIVKAVFDYLTSRKTTKIDYSESVAQTLAELNDRLKTEAKELRGESKELRDELALERSQRRTVEEQLIEVKQELREERRLRRELEERVRLLEDGESK